MRGEKHQDQGSQDEYRRPSRQENERGAQRRVGFELEFTGLTLDEATAAVTAALDGELTEGNAAQRQVKVGSLGKFTVEIDWNYLKKLAEKHEDFQQELTVLSDTASLVVPVEVVCPPITLSELATLDVLTNALREAGARGTDDSLLAAYGVHVNAEIPDLTAPVIDAYLKAYCLLQRWLVKTHDVNLTRRISPYIDLYPERYLKHVIRARNPSVQQQIDGYLKYNCTRNRALDMLPLFTEIDPQRIKRRVQDPRIKPRPTFHFRLPNCRIDIPGWSLAEAWNLWWVVDELANRPQDIEVLCADFLRSWRPLLGIDESKWLKRIDRWLAESGLA